MRISLIFLVLPLLLLASCSTPNVAPRKEYNVVATKASNPSKVRVKVSLQNQAVYVMEGDRPLLVAAACVGTSTNPTPTKVSRITSKTKHRRKYSWGYLVNDSTGGIRTGKPGEKRSGERYVGYPLGYWCEFKPAYGFHAGWVWPYPKSHGCIRLHFNAAPKFFDLVRVGTPVDIKRTQPEDQTLGKDLERPQDYNDPEFPPEVQLTNKIFELYEGPIYGS